MKKPLCLCLLTVFLLSAAVCLFLGRSWALAGLPQVKTGSFQKGSIVKRFTLSGSVRADEETLVVLEADSRYSARVEQLCVSVGESVEEGQELMRLSPCRELTNDLASARRSLEDARYALLQEEDEELYLAYEAWTQAEDACLAAPEDERLRENCRAKKAALEKLCEGDGSQGKLDRLREKHRRLKAYEESVLHLQGLYDALSSVRAPRAGTVLMLAGRVGEEFSLTQPAAKIVSEEEVRLSFPLTAEQAAYYQMAEGVARCDLRLGAARFPIEPPMLCAEGGKQSLQAAAPGGPLFYGAGAVLELEFSSGSGYVLPRSAVSVGEDGLARYYVLQQRQGFFGTEDYAAEREAVWLDYDEENVLLSDAATMETAIIETNAPLNDEGRVLATG